MPEPFERVPPDVIFRPGDLILFAGDEPMSRAIAWRTCTLAEYYWHRRRWSHIGICAEVTLPVIGPAVRIFESTTECRDPCLVCRRPVEGVQVHDVHARLNAYPGQVWRLRPKQSLSAGESGVLTRFLMSQVGKDYDWRRAAALAGPGFFSAATFRVPSDNAWFCSELAARGLQILTRIGADHDPEEFSPASLGRLVLHSGQVWPIGDDPAKSVKFPLKRG